MFPFKTPLMLAPYPVNDDANGVGMHDSAGDGAKPDSYEACLEFARDLHRRGVRHYKALVADFSKLDLVRALIEVGIEVTVRPYHMRPNGWYLVNPDVIAAYVALGARYFESNNEGNLRSEWPDDVMPSDAPKQIIDNFILNTETINSKGGISGLNALSPGGDWPHDDMYPKLFDRLWSAEECPLGMSYREWFFEKARQGLIFLAIHNRPGNHPLDYPDEAINQAEWQPKQGGDYRTLNQDSTAFKMYEWLICKMLERWGFVLPMKATEAGYAPHIQEDGRYPRIGIEEDSPDPVAYHEGANNLHRDLNLDIFDGFRTGRWREELMEQDMWICDHFGHMAWANEAWRSNNLPAWQALNAQFVKYRREYKALEIPGRLYDILMSCCQAYGVEPELAAATITAESAWNVQAYRPEPALNTVIGWETATDIVEDGSLGLGQILRSTAKGWGIVGDARLYDPNVNVDLMCKIIAGNFDAWQGDELKAVAAYNAGGGNVGKYSWDGLPQVRAYVLHVVALRNSYREQGLVRIEDGTQEVPPVPDTTPTLTPGGRDWRSWLQPGQPEDPLIAVDNLAGVCDAALGELRSLKADILERAGKVPDW